MQERSQRSQIRGLAWGSILMFLGLWFLLERLGIHLPDLDQLWPIFPTLGGGAFLLGYFTRENADPGLVWPGTAFTLCGVFFFFFTFEVVDWSDMDRLWPVFPLIGGLAFVATWAAGRCREPGLLVPGGMAIAVGVIGLLFTVGRWTLDQVELAGAVLLVLLGVRIIYRSLRRA